MRMTRKDLLWAAGTVTSVLIFISLVPYHVGASPQCSIVCTNGVCIQLCPTNTPTPTATPTPSPTQTPVGARPQQTITTITSSTPNSFPLPAGTAVCIVSKNVAQSPGLDYNYSGGAVVFITTPNVGDVVQLNCW